MKISNDNLFLNLTQRQNKEQQAKSNHKKYECQPLLRKPPVFDSFEKSK